MKDQRNQIFLYCWFFAAVATSPRTLTVLGRDVTLQKTCGSIADCTFDELCGVVSICLAYIILSDTLTDIFPRWLFFCNAETSVLFSHRQTFVLIRKIAEIAALQFSFFHPPHLFFLSLMSDSKLIYILNGRAL